MRGWSLSLAAFAGWYEHGPVHFWRAPGLALTCTRPSLDVDEGCARHLQPRAVEFGRGAVGGSSFGVAKCCQCRSRCVVGAVWRCQPRRVSRGPGQQRFGLATAAAHPAAPSLPPRRPSS